MVTLTAHSVVIQVFCADPEEHLKSMKEAICFVVRNQYPAIIDADKGQNAIAYSMDILEAMLTEAPNGPEMQRNGSN